METSGVEEIFLSKSSEESKKSCLKNVAYIYSKEFVKQCDQLSKVYHRASITHVLISAYRMLNYMRVIPPESADENDLRIFHAESYVQFLQKADSLSEDDDKDLFEEYGLSYDCPFFVNLYPYVCCIAGATLTAAKCLLSGKLDIVINWGGGWHHAKRDEAAGFCYINDVVLGILKLRTKFERVLYVDLDAHHGDGVEDAFAYTSKVMTVSFHKHEPGFYPGSGTIDDIGFGKGKHYAVNVPLQDGIIDEQYFDIFSRVIKLIKEYYAPSVVVCQCGADGLVGDPVDAFNLTPKGLGNCIKYLLSWNLPMLFLGGGGYNIPNTARCWTYLTSVILGFNLPSDIPDNPYFMLFGPDFDLDISEGNRPNKNTDKYLETVYKTIADRIKKDF